MNKFFAILGIVVLVGAGCTTQSEQSSTINTNTTPEKAVEANLEVNNEIKSDQEENTDDDNNEIGLVVEAVTDEPTKQEDEEKIIDVNLGDDFEQTIQMESGNFFFKPNKLTAKAGERIKITFKKNSGFHTIVIDEIGLKATVTEGESIIFSAPSKAGTYAFYCDIGSHRANGMKGTLVVK